MKYAAIDIGSNAIRLLFVNIYENEGNLYFHKIALMRAPVRLGADTFVKGYITPERKQDLLKTLVAFRNLMEVYQVTDSVCCATSAMRDAQNGYDIAEEVSEKSGIKVKIISGEEEAKAIYSNHIAEDLDSNKSYLYIDVGGGSTELSFFHDGIYRASKSFKIGTIRVLENLTEDNEWLNMKAFIKEHAPKYKNLEAIGTGGNINKIFKIAELKEGNLLSIKKIEAIKEYLEAFSYEERINILGLREDRADVILPASNIYLFVLNEAKIKDIYVPKLGLADGLIRQLYERNKKLNTKPLLTEDN